MPLLGSSIMQFLRTSIMMLLGTSIIISNVYFECPLSIRQSSFLSAKQSSVDRENQKSPDLLHFCKARCLLPLYSKQQMKKQNSTYFQASLEPLILITPREENLYWNWISHIESSRGKQEAIKEEDVRCPYCLLGTMLVSIRTLEF